MEMLQRGGRLHNDAGMYERRDRAKIGLGKGKCLSQPGDGDGGKAGG